MRSKWPLHLISQNGARSCGQLLQNYNLLTAFAATPTVSISEEFYLGGMIGVRLTPKTPVAEFSELKPRLHA